MATSAMEETMDVDEDVQEAGALSLTLWAGEEQIQGSVGDRAEHNAGPPKEEEGTCVQIKIPEDGRGYSYETIFKPYLSGVSEVWVEDAYVRQGHQLTNFVRFSEMLVKARVQKIHLITGQDRDSCSQQQQILGLTQLGQSLQDLGVLLTVQFSPTIHDREIRLDTGWIIKIGRGLDYFKTFGKQCRFNMGYHDLDLRQCYETTVDIFHRKNTKTLV